MSRSVLVCGSFGLGRKAFHGLLWLVLAGACCASGAQSISTETSSNATETHSVPSIGAGDMLSIVVFDTPSLSFQDRVDQSGNVKVPVLGLIHLAGLDTDKASRLVEEKLRSGNIMNHPSVLVEALEFATQGVVVLGQVRTPGTYILLGPHTLYDALSAAGGTTETQGSTITITHRVNPEQPEVISVKSANYSEVQRKTAVFPGDTVFVSKADVVYIVGDVARPGAYYIQDGRLLTVLNVLSLAGGDNATSKERRASIIRATADGPKSIPIDMHDIKRNHAPDLLLEANDVVVVPRSGAKVFMQAVLPGIATAGTSSAVSAALIR